MSAPPSIAGADGSSVGVLDEWEDQEGVWWLVRALQSWPPFLCIPPHAAATLAPTRMCADERTAPPLKNVPAPLETMVSEASFLCGPCK